MAEALDALVVGGGPTGLTMAGELARHGLRVRLVEKTVEPPPDQSRALAVQARTLEIFEQLGIVEEARARGRSSPGLNVLLPGGRRAHLSLEGFSSLATPFPEVLMLQQFETEALLASRLPGLGVVLERGVELVSYTQDEAGVTSTLRRVDGAVEQVRSRWLLGCDGARSQVRRSAGIDFEGETYEDQCLLGEVRVDWPLPDGEIYISPTRQGVVAAFPIRGERRFRIILILPEATAPTRPELPLAEFEGRLREMVPVPVRIEKAFWLTRYRLHHRVAARLRQGRAFLCGDAAHIHSPAGGQGMNTGIQDAFNLAWKLAAVEQGRMPAWVLDTYEEERLPVARRLVHFTDRLFGIMAGHGVEGRLLRALAPRLAARVFGLGRFQRGAVGFISQLRVRYRRSPLSTQLGLEPPRGPRAGDRAPDGTLRDAAGVPVRVFELLRGTHHTLLVFAGPAADRAAVERARALAQRVARPDVRAFVIGPEASGGLSDPGGVVQALYGVAATGAILIRPDGYLGLRSDPIREEQLELELARRFRGRVGRRSPPVASSP